jgi:hypothetical protein
LSAFETRFDSITQSLSSSLKLLQDQSLQQAQAQKEFFYLITQLVTPIVPKATDPQTPTGMQYAATTSSMPTSTELTNISSDTSEISEAPPEGIQIIASPAQANQPNQEIDTGGSSSAGGTAGPG